MESLAPELHRIIVDLLEPEDICNLTLTSKCLWGQYTPYHFSFLQVKATPRGVKAFENMLRCSHIVLAVRQIEYVTSEKPAMIEEFVPAKLSEGFRVALQSVNQFPYVASVGLSFAQFCAVPHGDNYNTQFASQDVTFRTEVLRTLFDALADPDYPMPSFKVLSINNLQNVTGTGLRNVSSLANVLSRMMELRLRIVNEQDLTPPTEDDDIMPENSWDYLEMHSFYKIFPKLWLSPTQENLTSLKLHNDKQWGYYPRTDLHEVHFPKLRKLDLGRYTFTKDHQMEWILSHGKTLEELVLDDCPIGVWVDILRENQHLPEDEIGEYTRKWSDYFMAIERKMINLKYFYYGVGDWDDLDHFNSNALEEEGIGDRGYFAFESSMGPSPWMVINDELNASLLAFNGYIFEWEGVLENDEEAYDHLMNKLEERRMGTVVQ